MQGGVLNNINSEVGLVSIGPLQRSLYDKLLVVLNVVHVKCVVLAMGVFVDKYEGSKRNDNMIEDDKIDSKALERSHLKVVLENFCKDDSFIDFVDNTIQWSDEMKQAALGVPYKIRQAVVQLAVNHYIYWFHLRKDNHYKKDFASPLDWRLDFVPIIADLWNAATDTKLTTTSKGNNKTGSANLYKPLFCSQGLGNKIVYPIENRSETFMQCLFHNEDELAQSKEIPLSALPIHHGAAYLYILPNNRYALQTRESKKPKSVIAFSLAYAWNVVANEDCTQLHTTHLVPTDAFLSSLFHQ